MNVEQPTQTATRKPSLICLLAWGGLILIGGILLIVLLSLFQSVAKDGVDSQKLPLLLIIVIWLVLFFLLQAATHPIRGRGDERRSWCERFPAQTDQEFDRFLHVVGDVLGLRTQRSCRLRPDDRVAALTQEWWCGDGLEIIELIMAIEREYGLELPQGFQERDQTLGNLFAYVIQHSSQGPDPSRPGRWTDPEKS